MADEGSRRQLDGRRVRQGPFFYVGLAVTACGLLLAWLLRDGPPSLLAVAVCVGASGAWSLLQLEVLPTPGWLQKTFGIFRRFGLALLLIAAGLFFVIEALAGRAAKGVPAFVLVAAGLTFFLVGAIVGQREDTVLRRTLVALFITAFTTTAIVFPPSLLFMVPFTVLSWIAVVRLVVQKHTGRDPLAGWSDERQLGLGCGITVLLALLIIGVLQLRSCVRQPGAPPPPKAVRLVDPKESPNVQRALQRQQHLSTPPRLAAS